MSVLRAIIYAETANNGLISVSHAINFGLNMGKLFLI